MSISTECCNKILFCHSWTGHFFSYNLKGFWAFLVAFPSLKVCQVVVVHNSFLRHLGGMECYSRILFCHSRTREFFSYNLQRFFDFPSCIPSSQGTSCSRRAGWLLKHFGGMECCSRTLFYHSWTGNFFSYKLEWVLDFSYCIPSSQGASSSCRAQWLLEAPLRGGML